MYSQEYCYLEFEGIIIKKKKSRGRLEKVQDKLQFFVIQILLHR